MVPPQFFIEALIYNFDIGDLMLFQQIQIGTPAIWVKTVDPYRIEDLITSFAKRSYFTINKNGFSHFVSGKWKPLLITIPNSESPSNPIVTTTADVSVAFDFMKNSPDFKDHTKTFIHHQHGDPKAFSMMFGSYIASSSYEYRSSFMNDDISLLPIQVIVLSPFDPPEDIAHMVYFHEDLYPTFDELHDILYHIYQSTGSDIVDKAKAKDIANSGLGLSESKFINLCLTSILETGSVDAQYIYKSKMSDIKKNGILEIIKPKIDFDSIGGLDNIKNIISNNLYFWNNPQEAQKYGIQPLRRILTVGVPGTGKSAICEATANALGLDLARTGVSQVMNSFIGQSEANMRMVFRQIKAMAPLCVWIDEFGRDMSGGQSSSHVDGGTTDRVHGEFLTGLQELPDNVFLMCAANQLTHLKPEMLRAERFDKIFFVGLPSFAERIDILKIYLPNFDFNLEQIAHSIKYFTGAEIKSLIKEVTFNIVSLYRRPITTQDILAQVPLTKNILWNKDRQMIKDLYAYAMNNWDWASTAQYDESSDILGKTKTNQSSNWTIKA